MAQRRLFPVGRQRAPLVATGLCALALFGCAVELDDDTEPPRVDPGTPEPGAPVAKPPVTDAAPDDAALDGNERDDAADTRGAVAAAVVQASRAAGGASVSRAVDEGPTDPEPDAGSLRGAEMLGWTEQHVARIERAQPLIIEACVRRSLDVDLVNAVIWVESKFNPKARGPAGARGLMQIMPSTARGIAKRIDRKPRYYDPEFNVDAGTWLLRRLIDKADGDVTRALVAYNRGWAYVTRHDDADDPWSEGLVAYLERVERARQAFEHSQFAGAETADGDEARRRIRPHAGPGATSPDDPVGSSPQGDGADEGGAESARASLH